MSHTITIEDIIQKTPDLPSFPAAALKVIKETRSPSANATNIGEILATDQALSARVLRLANSAYYGLERKVNSLPEAVVILGMQSVKNLATVAATYTWMKRPLTGYCLGTEAMWQHSFGTAIAAQLVAKKSGATEPDLAFTAGLLHDIGKTALSIWIENKIGAILLYAEREDISFDVAERKILGYDHGEVGSHICKSWNLPEEIEAAAHFHHRPSDAQEHKLTIDCVHIGEHLTTSCGLGIGGEGLQYHFDEGSLVRLRMKREELDEITPVFLKEYEAHELMFHDLTAA